MKLTVIGGGSSYTPELMEGLLTRYEGLPIDELWLEDIETGIHKLQTIHDLAQRMAKKTGLPIRIYQTIDRRAALKEADFIILQFRVGQLQAREKDELIPAKYGVIGQETNGPGGMLKAMRTIPVILDILRECEELCPNAWIINFTNPSGIITETVLRYTNWKKFIGLCNSSIGVKRNICKILDADFSRVKVDFAGLNHLIFGVRVYRDGLDASEEVIARLSEINRDKTAYPIENLPYTPEFIKALRVVPGPYLRYYYKHEMMREKVLKDADNCKSRAQIVQKLEEGLFEKYKDPLLDVKPPELAMRGGAYYSDAACDLMSGIYNNTYDVQVVNTLNNGAIIDLPADVAVEVSSIITKEGPRPVTIGRLPVQAAGIIHLIKAFELSVCEAAVKGDYDMALLAMTLHPFVRDEVLARSILDEMLAANKEFLPQFRHIT